MNDLTEINEILQRFRYPFAVTLRFNQIGKDNMVEKVDPFLLWEERQIRIILRQPFYFATERNGACFIDEPNFRLVEKRSDFIVESMEVTVEGILKVRCQGCAFLCFPGFGFGWGIYSPKTIIMQHYGWYDGLDYDSSFDGA